MTVLTRVRSTALALIAGAMIAPAAYAGLTPPDLTFYLQVNGENPLYFFPTATQTGPTSWNWSGNYEGTGWAMPSFSINADTDPMVNANITFTNNTLTTQTYTIVVTLPVDPIGPGSLMDGSMGGSITDSNGNGVATVAATAGGAIYSALIDGNVVATLLNDPFSASPANSGGTQTYGPASFGQPTPIGGPSVNTDIGIRLRFTLTPGDSVAMTSFFRVEPVPAPAGLALLALAGLAGSRRRR